MRLASPLALLCCLALPLGGCRKSDAQRAAEERAKARQVVEKSYALTPYRLLKLSMRAEGAPNRPPELDAIEAGLAALPLPKEGQKVEAETFLSLARLFYQSRSLLERSDEDQFPVLGPRLLHQEPPGPWYDNPVDHLAFGWAWYVAGVADRSGWIPSFELALYELGRAEPQPGWPPPAQAVARLPRGLLYATHDYHYAAEEELSGYLEALGKIPPEALVLSGRPPLQGHPLLLAAGHFARAWNRFGLDRQEPATQDIEAGLADLQRAGIENELTHWGWACVHWKRKRPAQAAQELEKLAESPFVEEEARAEIRASAQALREQGRAPGFLSQEKSALLIARALIARAGGMERILVTLLGEERGRAAYAPFARMVQIQEGIARHGNPAALAGKAGELKAAATAAGAKQIEGLKNRIGWGERAAEQPDAGASAK